MCENCRAYTADGRCKVLTSLKKGKCGFFETEEQYLRRQREYYNRIRDDVFLKNKVLNYLERMLGTVAEAHLSRCADEFGVDI